MRVGKSLHSPVCLFVLYLGRKKSIEEFLLNSAHLWLLTRGPDCYPACQCHIALQTWTDQIPFILRILLTLKITKFFSVAWSAWFSMKREGITPVAPKLYLDWAEYPCALSLLPFWFHTFICRLCAATCFFAAHAVFGQPHWYGM